MSCYLVVLCSSISSLEEQAYRKGISMPRAKRCGSALFCGSGCRKALSALSHLFCLKVAAALSHQFEPARPMLRFPSSPCCLSMASEAMRKFQTAECCSNNFPIRPNPCAGTACDCAHSALCMAATIVQWLTRALLAQAITRQRRRKHQHGRILVPAICLACERCVPGRHLGRIAARSRKATLQ